MNKNKDTQLIWENYQTHSIQTDEVVMADSEYSRALKSAKSLTKNANISMELDDIVDAIKAHKQALKFATSSTNKAAHRGYIQDLSKKIIMAK